MPFGDWQFWLVTIVAGGALWFVLKGILPKRRSRTDQSKDAGDASETSSHPVRLTVNKKRV